MRLIVMNDFKRVGVGASVFSGQRCDLVGTPG